MKKKHVQYFIRNDVIIITFTRVNVIITNDLDINKTLTTFGGLVYYTRKLYNNITRSVFRVAEPKKQTKSPLPFRLFPSRRCDFASFSPSQTRSARSTETTTSVSVTYFHYVFVSRRFTFRTQLPATIRFGRTIAVIRGQRKFEALVKPKRYAPGKLRTDRRAGTSIRVRYSSSWCVGFLSKGKEGIFARPRTITRAYSNGITLYNA